MIIALSQGKERLSESQENDEEERREHDVEQRGLEKSRKGV